MTTKVDDAEELNESREEYQAESDEDSILSEVETGRNCSSLSAILQTPSLLHCGDDQSETSGDPNFLRSKRRPMIISSSTPVLVGDQKTTENSGPKHISTPNCSKIMSRSHASSGFLRWHSNSKVVNSQEIHAETLSVGPETSWELPDNCNPQMKRPTRPHPALPYKCVRRYSFTSGVDLKKRKITTDKPKMNITI